MDAFEHQIRALLLEWPRMPGPVIAQRIRWPHSKAPLRKRLAIIRPECAGVDPVDRTVYEPGQIAQCDLWFPGAKDSGRFWSAAGVAGAGDDARFYRFMTTVVIPSRQGGDILSEM